MERINKQLIYLRECIVFIHMMFLQYEKTSDFQQFYTKLPASISIFSKIKGKTDLWFDWKKSFYF